MTDKKRFVMLEALRRLDIEDKKRKQEKRRVNQQTRQLLKDRGYVL